MTIILFVVDTSSSMNQRTCAGNSLLDMARTAIDAIYKVGARAPPLMGDMCTSVCNVCITDRRMCAAHAPHT